MTALARLQRSLRRRGARATAKAALGIVAARGVRAYRALRELAFDLRHGVRTRGIGERPAADTGVQRYEVTPPRVIRSVLRALPIAHDEFTFVDVGCGKGAALVVAAELPFRRLIGLELDVDLAERARANVRRLGVPVEIVLGDAAAYSLPLEPLVLYLYNPFVEPTLGRFLANVESSLRRSPRPLWLVYFQPDGRQLLDDAAFLAVVHERRRLAVYEARS